MIVTPHSCSCRSFHHRRVCPVTDSILLSNHCLLIEQGPGHGDVVEPLPVAGGFTPFEADRGHVPHFIFC